MIDKEKVLPLVKEEWTWLRDTPRESIWDKAQEVQRDEDWKRMQPLVEVSNDILAYLELMASQLPQGPKELGLFSARTPAALRDRLAALLQLDAEATP